MYSNILLALWNIFNVSNDLISSIYRKFCWTLQSIKSFHLEHQHCKHIFSLHVNIIFHVDQIRSKMCQNFSAYLAKCFLYARKHIKLHILYSAAILLSHVSWNFTTSINFHITDRFSLSFRNTIKKLKELMFASILLHRVLIYSK